MPTVRRELAPTSGATSSKFLELTAPDSARRTLPLVTVSTVLAFAFGNRDDGRPGPVNEALAAVVADIALATGAKVIAQWEIADVLVATHGLPAAGATAIRPVRQADGTVVYLSTRGVVEAAVAIAGGADQLGPTAVVAHADHAQRCLRRCRSLGVDARLPEGVELPKIYDPESGQPWTRSRDRYREHERKMAAREFGL